MTDTFTSIGAEASKIVNRWAWWQNALKGNFGPIHESHPEQGYYRTRSKGKPWEPVAIFYPEGSDELVAYRNGKEVDDIHSLWTWACRNPISFEAYEKALHGEGFDDEPKEALAPKNHNSVDADPMEALRIEYLGEKELAEQFLKSPIKTKADADKAAIWSKRLADIAKRATDQHKVEKQPALDETRRIDDKWRELKDEPKELSTKLKRHMDEYLREQDRIEQERQRKAREEADRIRREAEQAAAEASQAGDVAVANRAEALAQQAADAEREAQARNAAAGRTGAKVALRTFVSAQITDVEALLIALKDRPEITELVQSLANRAAKAGVSLPGMKIIEEKRAA
ncbi:hypothetical protein QFZ34_002102 [Phyllobacterium ifriqiyense]|uniref:Uncharacterized protein n=1 Tax=Phyllobacterium ifriqiyense TaxID=314238 RepID=A0ABU0S844_9HYPH|nr:hypothetical protein [Phyllobacterium ifriqiyense]MDQ0996920.1 hypothetical protein [Phyllobacterium ifriqiyense]